MFLRAGELLIEGTAAEVQNNPRVVDAYLR
jgi:ABC-type branched-subunit amino acid transport system ATPase component